MPWFVPTDGDPLLLGVRSPSLSLLNSPHRRKLQLAARIQAMCRAAPNPRRMAAAIGSALQEGGLLDEAPESVSALLSAITDSDQLDGALGTAGLSSRYRVASPEEQRALEETTAEAWSSRLSLHEMA